MAGNLHFDKGAWLSLRMLAIYSQFMECFPFVESCPSCNSNFHCWECSKESQDGSSKAKIRMCPIKFDITKAALPIMMAAFPPTTTTQTVAQTKAEEIQTEIIVGWMEEEDIQMEVVVLISMYNS